MRSFNPEIQERGVHSRWRRFRLPSLGYEEKLTPGYRLVHAYEVQSIGQDLVLLFSATHFSPSSPSGWKPREVIPYRRMTC